MENEKKSRYNFRWPPRVYRAEVEFMRFWKLIPVVLLFVFASCSEGADDSFEIFIRDFDFAQGLDDWTAEFTEYPLGETPESDSVYKWSASLSTLPGSGRPAVLLTCENLNGDIFMFLKKKISGLRPDTNYSIVFDISLATNSVTGQALVLKAGASELEPKKVIENGYYLLNIDKGQDYTSGENLQSFGDIGGLAPSSQEFVTVTKGNASTNQPILATTNSKGELWLVAGTDCMYTGTNSVFFSRISVVFSVND